MRLGMHQALVLFWDPTRLRANLVTEKELLGLQEREGEKKREKEDRKKEKKRETERKERAREERWLSR